MRKLFLNLFTLIAVVGFAAGYAHAETPFPTDGDPISTGTVYYVDMAYDSYATLTPTISGKLIQDGCPDLKISGLQGMYTGYGMYGQTYAWDVEAGKTYTIDAPIGIWNPGNVTFYMESEQGVTILDCYPPEGEVLSPNVNLSGDIIIHFNTEVMIESAALCVGDVEVELENSSILSNTVALQVKSILNSLYVNGTLDEAGGQTITINIKGLQSKSGLLYNGDGVLTLTYISSEKLADLVTSNVPSTLKSYYPEGDPDGIWVFVFDRDLMDDGQTTLTISCGNPQGEDMYYLETLYPKVDGATLTFDLCDKVRELDFYLGMQDVRAVAVKLGNVRDKQGNLALGGGQGNVGSYDFSLSYNYIKPQAVTSEFVPASGTSLEGVDEIEIWFNNADMISFEGVEFTYNTDNGFETVIVPKSELSMSLENNEMTIRVKVPESVKGHDQITVKLYEMTSVDGYDYRIEANYDMFVVGLLAPIKDGQTIASTGTEDFVFSINFSDYYFYIRYDFYNGPGEEGWVYGSQLTRQSNGTWTAYNDNFPCYSNFDPYMIVRAYYFEDDYLFGKDPVEEYKFTFHGTSEPFEFSDVKFVSITPEPNMEIELTPDFCFTVVYDGLVKIDAAMSGVIMGMGMGVLPFDKVEPIYDGPEYDEGYANTWCLYPNIDYVAELTSIDISIFAKDMEGKVVEGNLGAGEMDCLQFSYPIFSSSDLVNLTVTPADGETVESLSKFTVTYPGFDVSRNWNYNDVYPVVMNLDTWEIYTFTDEDMRFVSENGAYGMTLTCPEIKAEGMYMLSIPERFFIIGEQFTTYYNNAYFGVYTVSKEDGIKSISSESGAFEVYNMQGIRILNTTDANELKSLHGLFIINGKKVNLK